VRPLIISNHEREAAARVVAFAKDRQHWYRPEEPGEIAPGLQEGYVLNLWSYRCVFSYTFLRGQLYRHLSVSVPSPDALPNPVAVWTLAALFGFEDWDGKSYDAPKNWQLAQSVKDNCIVVAQKVAKLDAEPVRPAEVADECR
jgi:hypothetical protein